MIADWKPRTAWFAACILITLPSAAQYRIVFEPTIDFSAVHDDNLFYSSEPESDFIQRVRPVLELRVESPRWSATGSYEFDSDRYANHSSLTDMQSREQVSLNLRHRTTPRLQLELDAGHIDTTRPADLNLETGLFGSLTPLRRLAFRTAGRFHVSPLMQAYGTASSTTDRLSNDTMRTDIQVIGFERGMTPRDVLSASFEQNLYRFEQQGVVSHAHSYVLKGGWNRMLTPRTELHAEGGPRVNDGEVSPEFSVRLLHEWRYSSIAITAAQTETTAAGHIGTLQSRGVAARFEWTPSRALSTFVAPGVHRLRQREAAATVYRLAVGIEYEVNPLLSLHTTYSHDVQDGILHSLTSDVDVSRSTLFAGITARWKATTR